ncbi:peptidoglycan-binding domain-containing protein [Geminicoccus harenae]|uniref:peptidoglycan-binding domain-containing protein n=1 Tax=Geminicoccus harenae TaxID=2498453 RepID=UPI00168C0146|nr:peptidoglycan-binding domain-containing protein [Geminicoccus harenae]
MLARLPLGRNATRPLFLIVAVLTTLVADADAAAQNNAARLQWDLIWTGHYEATVDGRIGPATQRAIRSYQSAAGMLPSGELSQAQRKQLTADAAAAEAKAGWTIYQNPVAGYRIGYPAALLPLSRSLGPTGQEFYRGDMSANLAMLVTGPDSEAAFRASFDKIATDESHITVYKIFRPNWFVVSFLINDSGYYVMSRRKAGATASYVLRWPKSEDRSFRPVATAIANSFHVPANIAR